jgi:sulfur-oxidizing protein SoxY
MNAADAARRRHLQALAGVATLALAPPGRAQPVPDPPQRSLQQMTAPLVGSAPLLQQGLRLELPALADNGHVVPLRVVVDSPMTPADHVERLWLLSPRNPVMQMAVFHLGPWSGRAEVATRVRLAGTQTVVALARLSRGGFRYAQAEVVVTESACLDAG